MRLIRVDVAHFGCIRRASVELGPGLNVLYGPNDLGKSTFGRAIRAGLLLPHTSAQASDFVEWDSDEKPVVKLTLQLPSGRFWRIEKRFGGGSGGSSLLYESSDRQTFSVLKKGREVDEEIRTTLQWGIASPASKGAPRGLPTSFLATVLLGEQTDVAGILDRTLEADTDESGRLQLTAALAAFAQDPLFKTVLDEAQEKVDEAFTSKGGKRRGRTSPFQLVTDEVKRVQAHFQEIQRSVEESRAAQRSVTELGEDLTRRQEALDAAIEAHRALASVSAQQSERRRLEAARATALDQLEAQQRQVVQLVTDEEKLDEIHVTLAAAKAQHATAVAEQAAAMEAERAAEDGYRRAQSLEARQQRQLERSELEKKQLTLQAERKAAEMELEATQRVEAAVAEVAQLTEQHARAAARHESERRQVATLADRYRVLERTRRVATVARQVARWQQMRAEVRELRAVQAARDETRQQAEQRRTEAIELLDGISPALPTTETVEAMRDLERELHRAEASLGGELAVTIERLGDTPLVARADGRSQRVSEGITTFECHREVQIEVGRTARISVTAATRSALNHAQALRDRWASEVMPLLAQHGHSELSALESDVRAAERIRGRATALKAEADQLDAQARWRSEALARLPELERARDDLDAAIDPGLRAEAEAQLKARPGSQLQLQLDNEPDSPEAFEAKVSAELEQADADHRSAQDRLQRLLTESSILEERLASARRAVEDLGGAPPGGPRPKRRAELETHLAQLRADEAMVKAQLDAAGSAVDAEVTQAEQRLEAARAASTRAAEVASTAEARVDELQQQADRLAGAVDAQRHVVATLDIDARRRAVEVLDAQLAGLPAADPPVTDDDLAAGESRVRAAQRACDLTRDELHKAQGVFQAVGGQVVHEREEEAREALRIAAQKEKDVELEYEAWRLLVQKLREAENTEGRHLGEALSQPITERFAELTQDRYGRLEVAADLRTHGLRVAGGIRAVSTLSVGTQEQLATLFRITVAEQLGTTLVLDDHLTQTDPSRNAWFRRLLRDRARHCQIIVLTCRPSDYLDQPEVETAPEASIVRGIDMAQLVERSRYER